MLLTIYFEFADMPNLFSKKGEKDMKALSDHKPSHPGVKGRGVAVIRGQTST
jgi:hypothetical protein